MRAQPTGLLALFYVPTIANPAAPTIAEIQAGTDLTGSRTRDGLKTPNSGSTVDASDGSSLRNKTSAGTYGGDPISGTFYRDTLLANDTAWSTFTRGLTGYLVVARFGWAQDPTTGRGSVDGTPTAGDRCEVWPIEFVSKSMQDTAENEDHKFDVTLATPDEPEMDAVVAS